MTLMKLEEIIGKALLESHDKTVRLYGITSTGRKIDLQGYVMSESSRNYFHKVSAEYEPASKNLIYGNCDCEAYLYFGSPCKHILKLRNVYEKNEEKINKSSVQ